MQFEMYVSTPKAFTNSSPGLLQPWVQEKRTMTTLKVFGWQLQLLQS